MNPTEDILAERLTGLQRVIDERDRRYEDRFRATDEKTSLALTSSEKAVTKAEIATEKRFDAVNEFRATLGDQARLLIPREEVNARLSAIEAQIHALKEGFSKEINGLKESRSEGIGSKATWAVVLVLAVTLIGILLKFWK